MRVKTQALKCQAAPKTVSLNNCHRINKVTFFKQQSNNIQLTGMCAKPCLKSYLDEWSMLPGRHFGVRYLKVVPFSLFFCTLKMRKFVIQTVELPLQIPFVVQLRKFPDAPNITCFGHINMFGSSFICVCICSKFKGGRNFCGTTDTPYIAVMWCYVRL